MACDKCPGYHVGREKKCKEYLASRDFYEAFEQVKGFIRGRNEKEEAQRGEAQSQCYQRIIAEMCEVLYHNQLKKFRDITGAKGENALEILCEIEKLKRALPQVQLDYREIQKQIQDAHKQAGNLEQKAKETKDSLDKIQKTIG